MRSTVCWPEKICKTTPLLIMQGSADWRVEASGASASVRKLYELRHSVRVAFVEGGTYGLRVPLRDYLLYDWLDRYVHARALLPNLEPPGD